MQHKRKQQLFNSRVKRLEEFHLNAKSNKLGHSQFSRLLSITESWELWNSAPKSPTIIHNLMKTVVESMILHIGNEGAETIANSLDEGM